MKKGIALLTVLAALSGCGTENGVYSGETASELHTITESGGFAQSDETFDNECTVELGETVSIRGKGAWFENGSLSVTEGGVYNISGNLNDGALYIESDEPVRLVLKGFSADNPNGAAIICKKGRLSIESASNFANNLTATVSDAAVYADGELEFCGAGILTVKNKSGGGIYSGEELTISDCSLSVISGATAISSKAKIAINSGRVKIEGAGGLESGGRAEINGGRVFINAENFGIRASEESIINGTAVVSAPNFGSKFSVKNGLLLAFSNKGAAIPSSDYILAPVLDLSEQTAISAVDESGNVILSATLPKTAQEAVFSAANCSGIRLFSGGTFSSDPDELGIITDGELSGGTELSVSDSYNENAA